jgi:ribosomal protein L21E
MAEFKVGDRVKVTRAFRTDEGKDHLMWSTYMEKYVGMDLLVTKTNECGHVQLDCGWWFYPFVLEHVTQFNIGDRVRQIGPSEMGFTDHMGEIGTIVLLKGDMFVVDWENGGQNNMPPESIEHVTKHVAKILTEKVTVGGVPCRKILGFEGILSYDELPKKYMEGVPSFDLYESSASHYEFDGYGMQWRAVDGTSCSVGYNIPMDSDPIIGLGPSPVHVLTVGDIYPEATFQAIVVWLKRAGSRLAKIRQQEKDAWSGKETIEI